jgi:hypothetical protein
MKMCKVNTEPVQPVVKGPPGVCGALGYGRYERQTPERIGMPVAHVLAERPVVHRISICNFFDLDGTDSSSSGARLSK